MKIRWIEFRNNKTELNIERIYFNEDITLLVGLSGVGKTLILNAVEYSLELAVNKMIRLMPYSVCLEFSIKEKIYEWSYNINYINEKDEIINAEESLSFVNEQLKENGQIVFKRTENDVFISGYDKIPQPKKDTSIILQYSDDSKFKFLVSEMRKIFSIEVELSIRGGISSETYRRFKSSIDDKVKNDSEISYRAFSRLPVDLKLYAVKKYFHDDVYVKIFEAVKELFMEIQDIDVIEDIEREMYVIAISVYDKWLMQQDISNGMLKSIYYIVELMTMSENAVVLIDEFENGLGVNCIDLLSEMIFTERKDLQFIVTSHHPKIINFVDSNKWKIIDRDASIIKNSQSTQYGIGNSQHDAYFQLINRWEFEGKV